MDVPDSMFVITNAFGAFYAIRTCFGSFFIFRLIYINGRTFLIH